MVTNDMALLQGAVSQVTLVKNCVPGWTDIHFKMGYQNCPLQYVTTDTDSIACFQT